MMGQDAPSTRRADELARIGAGPRWWALIAFGAASRVIVLVVGCLLARPVSLTDFPASMLANQSGTARKLEAMSTGSRRWIQPWYRWDAFWYLDIAERGYSYYPGEQSNVAFMPLLPMIVSAGTRIGADPYWIGLIVPNFAFTIGLACFGRCAWRATASTATAWRACLLLVAFPTSFYFSAPYQEALGMSLTAAALLAWLARRPLQSAGALAFASAARITAIAMSLGLLLDWAWDMIRGRSARHSAWLVAIVGGSGTVAYYAYLSHRFHDPMLQVQVQAAWDRRPPSISQLAASLWGLVRIAIAEPRESLTFVAMILLLATWLFNGPLQKGMSRFTLAAFPRGAGRDDECRRSPSLSGWAFAAGAILLVGVVGAGAGIFGVSGFRRAPAFANQFLWAAFYSDLTPASAGKIRSVTSRDFFATLLFLGLGIHTLVKRGPLWACLVLIPPFQFLATGSFQSVSRAVLASFPAFLDAAEIASGRVVFALTVIGSLIVQFFLLKLYVNGTYFIA
jgi:hypothetical protein